MSNLKQQIQKAIENSKILYYNSENEEIYEICENDLLDNLLKLFKPVILINVSENTIESNTDMEIHVLDKSIKQITPITRTSEEINDIISNLYNISL